MFSCCFGSGSANGAANGEVAELRANSKEIAGGGKREGGEGEFGTGSNNSNGTAAILTSTSAASSDAALPSPSSHAPHLNAGSAAHGWGNEGEATGGVMASASFSSAVSSSAGGSLGQSGRSDVDASEPKRLSLRECSAMTSRFAESGYLGEGSFGKVYRGEWTEGRRKIPVAVKKLNEDSYQGYEEWMVEVLLLAKLHHPNLIRLLGFCSEGNEALLVYDLCANGSLEDRLLREGSSYSSLSWEQRVRIACGAAQGLCYLHEQNIIHRDFKAANVLLAEDMSARITDFGMARSGPSSNESHVSTRIMGTLGYLDPAYMVTGQLTQKSDVYAFGVILLELLTGRPAVGEEDGSHAMDHHWQHQHLSAALGPYLRSQRPDVALFIDPKLQQMGYSEEGALKVAVIAKCCIRQDPKNRPNMAAVVKFMGEVDLQ